MTVAPDRQGLADALWPPQARGQSHPEATDNFVEANRRLGEPAKGASMAKSMPVPLVIEYATDLRQSLAALVKQVSEVQRTAGQNLSRLEEHVESRRIAIEVTADKLS